MKQKSYQFSMVATVTAVLASLVMAVLKMCGLLAFSWWLVMAPIITLFIICLFAMVATLLFYDWAIKRIK